MDSLMKYVGQTSRCASLFRGKKLEEDGLNGYQHTYILRICENPGIYQEQLAHIIYVNKSNVTRQLSLLEKNGFITRSPCKSDRRQMHVYPTQKAHDVYPTVLKVLQEWNNALLEDFTLDERDQLISMMKKVSEKACKLMEQEDTAP